MEDVQVNVVSKDFLRFDLDISSHQDLMEHLDKHGFVVISNVANQSEVGDDF
jgi:hypothetical protein